MASVESTPLLSVNDSDKLGHPSVQETRQPSNHPRVLVLNTTSSSSVNRATQIDSQDDLSELLTLVNDKISKFQIALFREAILTRNFGFASLLEKYKYFVDIFSVLESNMPDQAVSFLVVVLERLGLAKDLVDSLRLHVKDEFSMDNEFLLDMLLTLADILSSIHDSVYCNFREQARRHLLNRFNSERLQKRENLISILMQRDLLKPEYLTYYFRWTSHAGAEKQIKKLSDLCKRHKIPEPVDWRKGLDGQVYSPSVPNPSSTDCTDPGNVGTSVQVAESFPDGFVSLDGPKRRGTSPHSNIHPPLFPVRGDLKPFSTNHEPEMDPTSVTSPETDKTDPPQYNFDPAEAEENGPKALVVPSAQRQQPHVTVAGERKDNDEGRSLTDPSDSVARYGSVNEDGPPRPPVSRSIPIDGSPSSSSALLVTRSNVILTHPDTTESNNTPIPNKRRLSTCKQLRCPIFGLIVGSLLILTTAVIIGGWIGYSSDCYLLLFAPPTSTSRFGSNTTNLLGCFSPSTTRSVYVEKSSSGTMLYDSAKLYSQKESELKIVENYLMPRLRHLESDSNYVDGNYFYGGIPVYIASKGKITYSAFFVTTHGELSCGFQLFLFSSRNGYNNLVNKNDISSSRYVQKSICIHVQSTPNATTIPFDIQNEGFYYVAVFVHDAVDLNLTISANLTSYDVSSIPEELCTLDDGNSACQIPVNNGGGFPGISQERVCILASSSSDDSYPVNITATTFDVNVSSVLFISFWAFILIIGLIVIFISFICCCCCVHKLFCKSV